MRLRPYQQAGIDKFLARPHPRRMFLSWEMGSGKTFAAIKAVIDLAPARALFIVPAVVRPMWSKLLAEYCPERALGSITMGRDTKTGSKATLARRDAAYAADWQIVSYDLVDEVALGPWELVVLDEVHNLRNPTTLTSKRVRALFEHNRDAAALGLSGTMIPNEAKNIWNPLHTFFPGEFGEPAKTGEVSWGFLNRYCFKESNGYGTRYFGLRPESRERLAAAVAPISHRVVTADFAEYLPPLFVEPLYAEKAPKDLAKFALDWAHEQYETPRIGIFTHLRETAREVADRISKRYPHIPVFLIIGDSSVEKRAEMLQASRDAEKCVVVGTTHALNEGISLSHLKAAVVLEWQTALSDMLQFLARFARQDSTTLAPTRVQLLTGPNDESRLQTLRERIEAFTAVFKAGRAEQLALEAFAERKMTEIEFQRELDAVVSGVSKRQQYKGFQDEEDDESDDD
jgi:superfamily II DNA or RNA helicase